MRKKIHLWRVTLVAACVVMICIALVYAFTKRYPSGRVIGQGTVVGVFRCISSGQEKYRIHHGKYTHNLRALHFQDNLREWVLDEIRESPGSSVIRIGNHGFLVCSAWPEGYRVVYIPISPDDNSYFIDQTGFIRRQETLADENSPILH